ncbi:MAG: glutaredoxin family protein [Deltaproteobacteria bacterium]|nr:glutaredoxin family protein [Deltaproteobacteria bacterium]
MFRVGIRQGRRALGICALAACLLACLSCGSAEESHLLSATRDLVARLGGDLAAEGGAGIADGAVRPQSEVREDGPTREPERAGEIVVIEVGEASELAEPEDDAPEPALYSYVDAQGGGHMVRGLHKVPEPYRAHAKNLSGSGGRVINRYESKTVPVARGTVAAAQSDYNPNRLEVTLYSADWCGSCRKAKRFLDREGVSYELRDIDLDPAARDEVRRILGSVRIPLLDIGGTYVSGYDPKEIRHVLRRS